MKESSDCRLASMGRALLLILAVATIGYGQNLLDHLAEIDAPTILMSASDMEEVVSTLGTRPCLLKSFNRKQLRQAIEAATRNVG